MKRILIIGNRFDKHLTRFIMGLRRLNIKYSIDILDASMRNGESDYDCLYDTVYVVKHTLPAFLYKIPGVSLLCKYYDSRKAFNAISSKYGVISIQYVTLLACILASSLKRVQAKVITAPWGSDVYRMPWSRKWLTRKVFDYSDYVTAMPYTKFGEDIKRIFHVPESKCVPLCFGSDVLDKISESCITKEDAKQQLFGDSQCYVIVCGYNASSAQNHIKIVECITSVKSELPSNTLIVLPMTYAKEASYMNKVKSALEETGINYTVLNEYLSDEDIVKLRKATDLFIHMQTTDAYSSTLHEYLLCGTCVINADWLRYPELERDGCPYLLADFSNLYNVILKCLRNEAYSKPIQIEVLETYKWSVQLELWNNHLLNLVNIGS